MSEAECCCPLNPLPAQDKARPKLLHVQGRAVTEGDLRAILQAYMAEGLLEDGEDDIEAAAARRQSGGTGCLLRPLGLRLKRDASPSRRPIKPAMPGRQRGVTAGWEGRHAISGGRRHRLSALPR